MKNERELRRNNTVAIFLPRAPRPALVDLADLDLAASITGTWRYHRTSARSVYVATDDYFAGDGRRRRLYLHRLLLDPPPGLVVDHINHDTLDNRRTNLRAVSPSLNNLNKIAPRSDNLSGVLGVTRHVTGLWQGRLMVDGKVVVCIYRHDKDEAGREIARAREELLAR